MMNKAFIFDWSGTLSDNFEGFYSTVSSMFRELGREPISREEVKLTFTLPYMRFWNHHVPHCTKAKQDELYLKHSAHIGETNTFPGVKTTLDYIASRRFIPFVVSSDPIARLHADIARTGLVFEKIVGLAYEKGPVIDSLVDEYNLDRKYTFYVGDTSGDVEAGKQANVKTIGISWGFQHRDVLAASNPDYLIDDISKIKDILTGFKCAGNNYINQT